MSLALREDSCETDGFAGAYDHSYEYGYDTTEAWNTHDKGCVNMRYIVPSLFKFL